ncbi:MAG: F0F1 ATP synthase subunit B family protein [Thermoanaerobaculia bacterium]
MSGGPIALLLAGGGEGAHTFLGLPYPFWQTLNLLAFLGLLVWLLRKPLVQFFQNRRAQVADSLGKAEADRDRAEAIAKEVGERLTRIEAEIESMRRNALEQARAEEAEIEAHAAEEAERIAARTVAELDARVRTARNDLTAYAADLAVELARELVAKNVTPEDEKRLVAEGVKNLAGDGR